MKSIEKKKTTVLKGKTDTNPIEIYSYIQEGKELYNKNTYKK